MRLTFLRVNEAVFGSLIKQEHVPELIPFFGAAALIENAVSAEARDLFNRFGRRQAFRASAFDLAISAKPEQATELEWRSFDIRPVSPSGDAIRRVWTVSAPFSRIAADEAINKAHWKSAWNAITKQDRWPAGFDMFYTCTDQPVEVCINIWKFLTLAELNTVEQDSKEEAARVALQVRRDLEKSRAEKAKAKSEDDEEEEPQRQPASVNKDLEAETLAARLDPTVDWIKSSSLARDFALFRHFGRKDGTRGWCTSTAAR